MHGGAARAVAKLFMGMALLFGFATLPVASAMHQEPNPYFAVSKIAAPSLAGCCQKVFSNPFPGAQQYVCSDNHSGAMNFMAASAHSSMDIRQWLADSGAAVGGESVVVVDDFAHKATATGKSNIKVRDSFGNFFLSKLIFGWYIRYLSSWHRLVFLQSVVLVSTHLQPIQARMIDHFCTPSRVSKNIICKLSETFFY